MIAMSITPQGEVKTTGAGDNRSIYASFAIKEVHITMLTSLTDFMATMPWIPYYHIPEAISSESLSANTLRDGYISEHGEEVYRHETDTPPCQHLQQCVTAQ